MLKPPLHIVSLSDEEAKSKEEEYDYYSTESEQE